MSKGELTRENIIRKAANLFNRKGFAGASMSELMQETGLKKGGIYNHFQTKEEISVEAFDFAVSEINNAVYAATREKQSAEAKLKTIITFYEDYALQPIISGGCPILNTAVEADDANPVLKARVKEALENWISNTARLIEKGQREGEFKPEVNSRQAAIFIISGIEGGIAMTRSLDDDSVMKTISQQLLRYVDGELKV